MTQGFLGSPKLCFTQQVQSTLLKTNRKLGKLSQETGKSLPQVHLAVTMAAGLPGPVALPCHIGASLLLPVFDMYQMLNRQHDSTSDPRH